MSVIQAIVEKKRARLAGAKSRVPLRELRGRASDAEPPRDFAGAVKAAEGRIRLIAEIKKASPSKGPIRLDFDPAEVARIYDGYADAISVITEEDFFLGSLSYIARARGASGLPVLRKDFVFDDYQLYEARAAGADAVLLIGGLLERAQAREYLALAAELGMAALYEVHDEAELERALLVDAPIIGINNRDLRTLKIDIGTTLNLKAAVPPDRTVVAESGIRDRQDVVRFEKLGVDAVLVGTTLMEAPDIEAKLRELLGR